MAAVAHPPQMNGVGKKPSTPQAPVKKGNAPAAPTARKAPTATRAAPRAAQPVTAKAASVAGERPASQAAPSAYSIMASRIANRVAEMAESITFVEKPKAKEPEPMLDEKRRPRKLEMRLNQGTPESVAFSAPFLDNTLQKMLQLQNRMLQSTAELSKAGGVSEKIIKEHAAQSAELSRIIALICAEKARQGA